MKHTFIIYFSLCIFFLTGNLYAQSDNLCPGLAPPAIAVNACAGPTNYTIASSFVPEPATTFPVGTPCVPASYNYRDGFFQFTATSTLTTIIGTVSSSSRDLALVVYNSSNIVCNSSPATITTEACMNAGLGGVTETISNMTTVVGTVYYIRIIETSNLSNPVSNPNSSMSGTISIYGILVNDDCSGAISITPGIPGAACTPVCGNNYGATISTPVAACYSNMRRDVWFQFVATQAIHTITVTPSSGLDAGVEILGGNCGAPNSIRCFNNSSSNGGIETWTETTFIPGTTYYIRVFDRNGTSPGPSTNQFQLCLTSPIMPNCPANLGGGVVNVASLPYSATRSTSGQGNEFTATNTSTCGSTSYLQGNDEVLIFTPTLTGTITVSVTSSTASVGVMLYNGCPFIGQGGSCIAYAQQSAAGTQGFCALVNQGVTYYMIVDRNSSGGTISSYTVNISAPSAGTAGATCATAVPITTLPYNITNQTTLCKGDDYGNASNGSCNSVYESGEDMVFSYSTAGPECINVALTNASSIQAGFLLYQDCPGTSTAVCLGYVGGGNVNGNFTLPAAGTYYIIVDTWSPPGAITFDLTVTSLVGNSPNDYPCFATPLILGVTASGDNRCSSGLQEPGVPSCWTTGELNTVWYQVNPTGNSLIIRTTSGTLINTQIALYSGSCGLLTFVTGACNTDGGCGSNVTPNASMVVTGLTAGQNYYIRVDGELDLTGTFGILATDGGAGATPVYAQDCSSPISPCSNSSSVGNPGYSGNGNICDFSSGANCLSSGERGSTWYRLPIGASGVLQFDIIPNDWPGTGTTSTDYDFAIWEVGASGLTCTQLATAIPVRCNSNTLGVTGIFPGGNSPSMYPGFDNSYENSITVTAGQVYMLMISNASVSSSGFTLNITSSPDPVTYTGAPTFLTWSGNTNNSWGVTGNWGSCTLPTCGIDAVIPSVAGSSPVVSGTQNVKTVFINTGATLTLAANSTLNVCGDFVNDGNFVALPGSTVKFVGSGAQKIQGSFTGANAFANLTMAKSAGTLKLINNIDINENDSLNSGFFDLNATSPSPRYIRVKGNFYIANGPLNHPTPALYSTYEFNAASPQTYTNGGDDIDFYNVFMNHSPASKLSLGTGLNNNLNVKNILTLTKGVIVTGAKEVVIKNQANLAVINQNVTSYVEGNLRRFLNTNAMGVYEFPVGHLIKGYQNAKIDFTSATQIPQLVASFNSWGSLPNGPVSSECPNNNYSLLPALDNGFWTINASANGSTGIYNIYLNNLNYTNAAVGFTVMKRSPSGTGTWSLNGNCLASSTALSTIRTGLSGFSDFATAQSQNPLPVKLLSFDARLRSGGVMTSWITVSEINNSYFVVERSSDGRNFETVGRVDGAGNSTEMRSYSLLDENPFTGISYYRLKQVDYDGAFSYSEMVAIKVNSSGDDISVFPNPANSEINYEFESERIDAATIEVTDVLGNIVYTDKLSLLSGVFRSQINIGGFSDGVYNLRITGKDSVHKAKFIKK